MPLLLLILLCAIMAFRFGKWRLMLVPTLITALLYFAGEATVTEHAGLCWEAVTKDGNTGFYLFLLSSVLTAAFWINQKQKADETEKKRQRHENRIQSITAKGFVEEEEVKHIKEWDSYITSLSERLTKTRLNDDSFALGIAGDWGSGKTTFLRQLKRQLSETFEVVEFNPWICTNPNTLISDFFSTLSSHLPHNNRRLIRSIKEYADYLADAEAFPKSLTLLWKLTGGSEKASIQEQKEYIDKQLRQSRLRYAILIDDLDRLERNELFEILRLIRVSANFGNLMFVVTYDRRHILQMLKASDITEGEQFVKKIFNTEIVLPELEPYVLPNLLVDEFKRLTASDEVPAEISQAILSRNSLNEYEILRYLQNYRDVKRFAMALVADMDNIDLGKTKEFAYDDFFWLVLLRYVDYDTYNRLRYYPSAYLRENGSILELKPEGYDGQQETSSLPLLEKLFAANRKTRPYNSIIYKNNFHNYFSFRVQHDKVSQEEFKALLQKQPEDLPSAIAQLNKENKIMSLYELVNQTDNKTLPDIQSKKNHISILLLLTKYLDYYTPRVREKLQKLCFAESDLEALGTHTKELLTKINDDGYISQEKTNVLLSRLYSKILLDETSEDEVVVSYQSLVDDGYLIQESEKNMRKLLSERQEKIRIEQMTEKGSYLRRLMEASTVISHEDVSYDPAETYYKCLPFNSILEHFETHPSSELDKFMEPIRFTDEDLPYVEDPGFMESRYNEIKRIVGSMENLKQLILRCFTNPDEEKQQWLAYWKIEDEQGS